jgi:hypothetical protein
MSVVEQQLARPEQQLEGNLTAESSLLASSQIMCPVASTFKPGFGEQVQVL